MKILQYKFRKLLRTVLKGIVAISTILFPGLPLFIGCGVPEYGVLEPLGPVEWGDNIPIHGTVKCKETENIIPGIHITFQGIENIYNRTDKNGNFEILVPKQETMTIQFEDVDGSYNGGLFEKKTMEFNLTENDWDKGLGVIHLHKGR